jgi:GTP-binding protein EngB required for normal cell division
MTTTLSRTTGHTAAATAHDTATSTAATATTTSRRPLPDRVQAAYTTRFVADAIAVDPDAFELVAGPGVHPRAGDVVVARVTRIGNHKRIETPESRKAILFDDHLVMVAYGNRYAADQFLAHVPGELEPCHLVAAGGIAGTVTAQHDRIGSPTQLEPLGLVADARGIVNLADYAPYRASSTGAPIRPVDSRGVARPEVIAVLGTSMNSGKSTAMATLINGLTKSGLRVSAGKATGTGAGNDPTLYADGGAERVLDFSDFGYGTTFKLAMPQIRALTFGLIEQLATDDPDAVVIEIADGVFQHETAQLLRDPDFQAAVDHVVFAATDALGALAGVRELQEAGLRVSVATGVLTSSPLATAEAERALASLDVPVIGTHDLAAPERAVALLERTK